MGTIVVGYDASDSAREALAAALALATPLGDNVHVVVSYEVHRFGGEVADFAAALAERAHTLVGHANDQAAALHGSIDAEVVEGAPADALVDVADRLGARLIVVGTRGESPLRGALVGSTPHKLLQVADRPVLVVPG